MVKTTRSRSAVDKNEQFEKILFEGRRLFYSHGSEGFRMQKLADRLGMSKANLYNYVISKRDLWFAIYTESFKHFENGITILMNQNHPSIVDLLMDVAKYYYDFALSDKKRFFLMFESLPPYKTKESGPFEKNRQINAMLLLNRILRQAIDNKEIPDLDVNLLSFYFWSKVHGITIISYNIEIGSVNGSLPPNFVQNLKKLFFQQLRNEIKAYISTEFLVEMKKERIDSKEDIPSNDSLKQNLDNFRIGKDTLDKKLDEFFAEDEIFKKSCFFCK